MDTLATGLTISVALALAMPAWAQTPTTTHGVHRGTAHHYRAAPYHYSLADRLNAEELATLQGAGPVHRMPSGGRQLTTPDR